MVRAFRCDGGWQPHLLSAHLAPAPWPPTTPSRGASRVEPAPPPSRPAAACPRPRAVAARPCRPRASRLAVVNGSADALARRVSGPRASASRRALSLCGLAAPPLLPLSPAGSTRVGHQPEPPVPAPKRRRPVWRAVALPWRTRQRFPTRCAHPRPPSAPRPTQGGRRRWLALQACEQGR